MDTFFIRTRLQCLIAMQIESERPLGSEFLIVFLYQNGRDEDSDLTYALYRTFEERSSKAVHLVTGDGFLKSFAKALLIVAQTTIKGGTCFLATIDSLPIALAMRMCPLAGLETFDDGAANILRSSNYFKDQSNIKTGLKGVLTRIMFPKGWAFWMRSFTRKHYTIFPDRENIVNRDRLKILNFNWEKLLIPADIEGIDDNISKIILGTCFSDFPSSERVKGVAQDLATRADLYISHPRELSAVKGGNVKSFRSPAEALLIHFSQKKQIKVSHFNSTTAYALEGIKNIEFINLIDPNTFELVSEGKDQVFDRPKDNQK